MKYYLIAGEASGDLHGSNLMKGLLRSDPQAEFRFWGGDLMAAVGGREHLAKHYRDASFFGIGEIVRRLPTVLAQIRECKRDIVAMPARAGAHRLSGVQLPDGEVRPRVRHPCILLHFAQGVGVEGASCGTNPPVCGQAVHHLPLRGGVFRPTGNRCGI